MPSTSAPLRPSLPRPLREVFLGAALTLLASTAAAKEGGNSCPWEQDITLTLDRASITLPQAIFSASTPAINVDGHEVEVDLKSMALRIVGPRGHVWEVALTHLAGGKRCKAYYAGRPTLVFDPLGDESGNRVARR